MMGGNGKADMEALKEAGVNSHYYESPLTAHEWQSWRRSLNAFAPLLFQDQPLSPASAQTAVETSAATPASAAKDSPDPRPASPRPSRIRAATSGWRSKVSRGARPLRAIRGRRLPEPRIRACFWMSIIQWTPFPANFPTASIWRNSTLRRRTRGITGPGQRVFSFKVQGHDFKDVDLWVKAGGPNRAYIESCRWK